MTPSEAESLIATLQGYYPHYPLSSQQHSLLRGWFATYDVNVVSKSIAALVEFASIPDLARLRGLIIERTPARSDYQNRSRQEREQAEKNREAVAAVLARLSSDEYARLAREIVAEYGLERFIGNRDFRSSVWIQNLVYGKVVAARQSK